MAEFHKIMQIIGTKKFNIFVTLLAFLAVVYISGNLGAGEFLNTHIAFGYGGGGAGALNIQPIVAVNQPLYMPSLIREGRLFHKAENNMLLELEIPPVSIPANTKGYSVFKAEDVAVNPSIAPTCNIDNASIVGGRVFNLTANEVDSGDWLRDFTGKLTISLTIPALPEDTDNLGVYYLNAHNRWSLIQKAYFNPQNKTAFHVNNLAVFAVIDAPGLPKLIESAGNCFAAPSPTFSARVLGVKKYAEGTLLRTPDYKIYCVENNTVRHIKTLEELDQYKSSNIVNIKTEELFNYQNLVFLNPDVIVGGGDPIVREDGQQVLGVKTKRVTDRKVYADGAYVRTPDNKVYLVENAVVMHVATLPKSVTQWSGTRIYDISSDDLALYRNQRVVPEIQEVKNIEKYEAGEMLQTRDWKIYLIERNTVKHVATIPEPGLKHYLGKSVYQVDYGTLYHYQDRKIPLPPQQVLGVKKYADNSLIRTSDNKVYVIVDQKARHLATLSQLQSYAGQTIFNVDSETLAYYQGKTTIPTIDGQQTVGGPQKVLGVKQYADGTILRTQDWKVYIVEDQKIRLVAIIPAPQDNYQGSKILDVDYAVIAEYERVN